jgi:hypothetical protein
MYRDIEPIVQFRHHGPIHFGIGSILGPNPTRSARRPTLTNTHKTNIFAYCNFSWSILELLPHHAKF